MYTISDKIGGLPFLSWIWGLGPWGAALTVAFADFGVVCLLMMAEGIPPWKREQYVTFVFNDLLFFPLYVAAAVFILREASAFSGFFTTTTWHAGVLIVGIALSLCIEILAVKNEQYTISQELSPSKIWHTLIFGVMFYWLMSVFPFLLMTRKPSWAMALIALAFVGFIGMIIIDQKVRRPWDAHLEGTYVPWHWHVRPR